MRTNKSGKRIILQYMVYSSGWYTTTNRMNNTLLLGKIATHFAPVM